jgi:hypothetical protein
MKDKQDKPDAIEAEVVDNKESEEKCSEDKAQTRRPCCDVKPEIFSRIFYTILFCFIGWMALWVFAFVVMIQFGFLLITGQVNVNLKGFNKEVGSFLTDLIQYLSFQTDEKPFPFRDWPYGDENKNELNPQEAVKTSK